MAVNTVDFFNQINMLYGTITEFCTEENCPLMSAGPKYEYHWVRRAAQLQPVFRGALLTLRIVVVVVVQADGQQVKKPIKCSAPKYIDYLMTWAQDQLDDEALFPSKIGVLDDELLAAAIS